MDDTIKLLTQKMIEFDTGEPELIQHFLKVHRFAQMICESEKIDAHTQFVTECAAIVHDIGIKPATQKFGYCNGKLQEEIGPDFARKMLTETGLDDADTDRICYLIAHHHTYTDIDKIDYQILVEADFLVNFFENSNDTDTIERTMKKIFKTATGIKICRIMYGI